MGTETSPKLRVKLPLILLEAERVGKRSKVREGMTATTEGELVGSRGGEYECAHVHGCLHCLQMLGRMTSSEINS